MTLNVSTYDAQMFKAIVINDWRRHISMLSSSTNGSVCLLLSSSSELGVELYACCSTPTTSKSRFKCLINSAGWRDRKREKAGTKFCLVKVPKRHKEPPADPVECRRLIQD